MNASSIIREDTSASSGVAERQRCAADVRDRDRSACTIASAASGSPAFSTFRSLGSAPQDLEIRRGVVLDAESHLRTELVVGALDRGRPHRTPSGTDGVSDGGAPDTSRLPGPRLHSRPGTGHFCGVRPWRGVPPRDGTSDAGFRDGGATAPPTPSPHGARRSVVVVRALLGAVGVEESRRTTPASGAEPTSSPVRREQSSKCGGASGFHGDPPRARRRGQPLGGRHSGEQMSARRIVGFIFAPLR